MQNEKKQNNSQAGEVFEHPNEPVVLTIQRLINETETERKQNIIKSVDDYLDCSGIQDGLRALQEVSAHWAISETYGTDYKNEVLTELTHITQLIANLAKDDSYAKESVFYELIEIVKLNE